MILTANLIVICATAFLAVFSLLVLLAIIMKIITSIFPEQKADDSDTALYTTVIATYAKSFPGYRVTKIEEHK